MLVPLSPGNRVVWIVGPVALTERIADIPTGVIVRLHKALSKLMECRLSMFGSYVTRIRVSDTIRIRYTDTDTGIRCNTYLIRGYTILKKQ
jgi:hypothetical protein